MIPVNEPLLAGREAEYVEQCIKTGWISSSGNFLIRFEEQWASYCGRKYGVAVSNGTVALELALECLSLSPGDEVIMPTFTIISCAQAVVRRGCIPVFVDSEADTWCMDCSQIERKITSRTKAIMPVHIYGHPVDMDEVLRLSEKFGLAVIEDAAEAHGAEHRGRRCGSFGTISCFSFYANKIITTGEGGMLLTDDPDIAKKARELRNLCFVPEQRFLHRELGHNFRLTNLQSAIGVAQLERIEAFLQRKREMAARYSSRLSNSEKLQLPVERPGVKNVYWMFGIVLKESALFDATRFAGVLASRGIETRPFFLGMHEQPALHDLEGLRFEKHPVSEWLSRYGLYLPSGNALTDDQIDYVCDVVLDELK